MGRSSVEEKESAAFFPLLLMLFPPPFLLDVAQYGYFVEFNLTGSSLFFVDRLQTVKGSQELLLRGPLDLTGGGSWRQGEPLSVFCDLPRPLGRLLIYATA